MSNTTVGNGLWECINKTLDTVDNVLEVTMSLDNNGGIVGKSNSILEALLNIALTVDGLWWWDAASGADRVDLTEDSVDISRDGCERSLGLNILDESAELREEVADTFNALEDVADLE